MEETSTVSNIETRVKLCAKRRICSHSQNKSTKDDWLYLLQIFPFETWTSISSKLTNCPTDFENLSNSSPFFRNLMGFKSTSVLFEEVFALVAPTVWRNEGLQGLLVKDILNCRQVCSQWNHAVDKLIPEKFQHFGKESEHGSESNMIGHTFKSIMINEFKNLDDILDEDSVQNCLHHFEHTHKSNGRCPFIWGTLSVEISSAVDQDDYEEDYQHYLEGISSVLHKYGGYLHHFSIHINNCEFFEDVSRLQIWFEHTPHLKELNFCSDTDWKNEFVYLEEYQTDNPFPKFIFLETLRVDNLPEPVFNQLISQNTQITTLSITTWMEDYDFFTFPLPNLKSLQTGCCPAELLWKLESRHVQWPLESLAMEFENDVNSDDAVGYINLFELIQDKFADTLVALDVKLNCYEHDAEDAFAEKCKSFRLDLPKLRKIKISMCDFEILCLDFLLPMRYNLEEISLGVQNVISSYLLLFVHFMYSFS